MKTPYSRLAIVGFLLSAGIIAAGMLHLGLLLVLGFPVGLAALITGTISLRSIAKSRGALRGKALAIFATAFGGIITAISFFAICVWIVQQNIPGQQRQQFMHQAMQMDRELPRTLMPDLTATNFTSNLPVIVLRTDGKYISKESSAVVRMQVFDKQNQNGRASVMGKPDYDGFASIHLRGSTTLQLPKRSYTLHTVDASGHQIKAPLLGLPQEEDWVLYAPFEDKTLIRDVLAYELMRNMGHYAPRTKYFELFLQSSEQPLAMRDYAGVYVLIEKIKRGKERVNISKLHSEDRFEPEITGGYILKRDHQDRNETRFHTARGGPYFFVYPKPGEITAQQKAWIASYFNQFESALYGPEFKNARTGYAAYLDVDSFIDAHWLIETSKNVDGFRYSAYLTKDREGKIVSGPPWDWNRSFGNANYYGGGQTHGWYWSNLRPTEISWFLRLRDDRAFVQRSTQRWLALRKDILDPARISRRIDELAAELNEAQERNFRRWPVLGRHVTCNYYVGQTYAEEVRWMKHWIEQRIAWIDKQLGNPASAEAEAEAEP